MALVMRCERGVEGAVQAYQRKFCRGNIADIPMRSLVIPLHVACMSPIKPQALPIVCLNQSTSSSVPVPA